MPRQKELRAVFLICVLRASTWDNLLGALATWRFVFDWNSSVGIAPLAGAHWNSGVACFIRSAI
jgi:hypothetical protein